MTILLLGIATAIGAWIIMFKLGIRKVLNFEVPIDVAFTLGLVAYLSGTISGAMIGVVAGIALSILLAMSKKLFGIEKIQWPWKVKKEEKLTLDDFEVRDET